jgi:hypothetical protein
MKKLLARVCYAYLKDLGIGKTTFHTALKMHLLPATNIKQRLLLPTIKYLSKQMRWSALWFWWPAIHIIRSADSPAGFANAGRYGRKCY